MGKRVEPRFSSEAELCRAFASCIPEGWTAYNEACGFDIVLAHETGYQIGVEAKLTLNAKVLAQVIHRRWQCGRSPDFRAVLVGRIVAENAILAKALEVTVLTIQEQPTRFRMVNWQGPERAIWKLSRELPEIKPAKYFPKQYDWMRRDEWFDEAPVERLDLPDYVPDVEAGHPSPMVLSDWKIKAIKVCVHVETGAPVTRRTFKDLKIDPSRWLNGHWMRQAETRGQWVPGEGFPADAFRKQHPDVFPQIEADYPTWAKAAGLIA